MKTNRLPRSAWSDTQEAGSQSMQTSQSSVYYSKDNKQQTGYASNDATYNYDSSNDEHAYYLEKKTTAEDTVFGYQRAGKGPEPTRESAMNANNPKNDGLKDDSIKSSHIQNSISSDDASGHKKPQKSHQKEPLLSELEDKRFDNMKDALQREFKEQDAKKQGIKKQNDKTTVIENQNIKTPIDRKSGFEQDINSSYTEIPERVFMNGLVKHTGIALAIIIPLAAFTAYAATPPMTPPSANNAVNAKTTVETLSVAPNSIIHKSANTPTTVDRVDLKKYAGTWYEIGRLPMYFQRNCASNVTATYTEKTDGSGIIVTNKCADKEGSDIIAEGIAKPVDATGNKLKVSFLPTWIRWLPVGRADYWVLARDPDYKTALVGTPDKDYLWLLARSPNISQETYAKYRQIAQQQGYNLKEFKLTPQTNQTVSLIP